MNELLVGIQAVHGQLLVERVEQQLKIAGGTHYQNLDERQLRVVVESLQGTFFDAALNGSSSFTDYIESIAEERQTEGFTLKEIQTALRIFEANIWQLICAEIPFDDRTSCLAYASEIIGAAKDNLAQAYLDLMMNAGGAQAPDPDLQECFARGTDPEPVTEEDRISVPRIKRQVVFSHSFGKLTYPLLKSRGGHHE